MTKKFLILPLALLILAFLPYTQGLTNYQSIDHFYNPSTMQPYMPYPPYDYAEYTINGHNGNPAIHVLENSGIYSGEVNGNWVAISSGEHIVCGGWVKTGVYNGTDLQAGAGFGFDFCATTSEGFGIIGTDRVQVGHPTGTEKAYGDPNATGYSINGANGLSQVNGQVVKIPFNTDWTYIEWDFTVPSTYYNHVWREGTDMECDPVQISHMVMWTWVNDNGEAWFSEPFMYILGDSIPTDSTDSIFGNTWSGNLLLLGTITISAGIIYKFTEKWHQY